MFTRYIESELQGHPDLIAKALPDYPPFIKRMLLDTCWYRALRRDHVDLITEGVTEITPDGLRGSDGTEIDVDIIVPASGFHTHRFLWPIDVRGRSGASLSETWGPENAQRRQQLDPGHRRRGRRHLRAPAPRGSQPWPRR